MQEQYYQNFGSESYGVEMDDDVEQEELQEEAEEEQSEDNEDDEGQDETEVNQYVGL